MATTIKIRNVKELKQFVNKLLALSRTLPLIQKRALERTADEALLGDIHREMETKGISKKIIETTYVGPIEITQGKVVAIHIISDYVADNGFEVGTAREEGTQDHFIPRKKKILSWIDSRSGRRVFDPKGHMVSGLPRLLIIERTIAKNKQKVQDSYENNIVTAYRQALGV